MIGVLTVAYDVPLPEATAITILDWAISVLSIIVFGAILYVVSPMPRGMGRIPQTGCHTGPDDRLSSPRWRSGTDQALRTGLIPSVDGRRTNSQGCPRGAPPSTAIHRTGLHAILHDKRNGTGTNG